MPENIAFMCFILIALLATQPGLAEEQNKPSEGLDVSCRDKSACTEVDCSDRAYAFRSGQLCRGWPGYNGRYPISPIEYSDENEFYQCMSFQNMNASQADFLGACAAWSTLEVGHGERETGTCTCTAFGSAFCQTWRCVQNEEDLCDAGESQQGDQCCYTDSDGDEYCYLRETETEITNCRCDTTRPNLDVSGAEFCVAWSYVIGGA